MVVSLRSSHAFGISVVWNNVVIVAELFMADRAYPILFDNFPVQQFPHFCRRPEFPVSSRVKGSSMRCTPNLISLGLGMSSLPQQENDLWIGHNSLRRSLMAFLLTDLVKWLGLAGTQGRKDLNADGAATIPARGKSMSNLVNVVQQLKKERNQAQQRIEQLDEALKALGGLGGLRGRLGRTGSTQMPGKKRRNMSPAARKRIAAAQRARWAKWKAARRGK